MKIFAKKNTFFHKNSVTLIFTAGLAFLPAACGCTFPSVAHNSSPKSNIVINITTGSNKMLNGQQRTFTVLKLHHAISHKDSAAVIEEIPSLLRICKENKFDTVEHIVSGTIGFLTLNGQVQEAYNLTEELIKIYPDSVKLISIYAEFLSDRDHLDEAVSLLKNFSAKNKELENTINAELIPLYLDHNQEDKAKELLANLKLSEFSEERQLQYIQLLVRFKLYNKGRTGLNVLLKNNPELYDALQLKAILEKESGNVKEAIKISKKLLSVNGYSDFARHILLEYIFSGKYKYAPEKLIIKAEDPLKFSMSSARFFATNNQPEKAEKVFQLYEKFSSHPTDIYFEHAAFLCISDDKIEQALGLINKIPSTHADYARALCLKISIFYDKKDKANILATVAEFEKIENPDSAALFNLIELLVYSGINEEAADRLITKAQILYPDNSMSAFFRAYAFGNSGDMETAAALMEDVIKKDPNNALALNYVGYYLADEGRELDRALDLIVKANKILPNTDFITDSLAWVFYKRKEPDKAWKVMDNLVKSMIRTNKALDPSILDHYGDIAIEVGEKDTARKAWKGACEIFQKNNKPDEFKKVNAKLNTLK